MGDFRLVQEVEVHRAARFTVAKGTFAGPDGTEFERDVVRSPGAVATVAITYDDADTAEERPLVTLIRQYRPPLDELLVEIPAGMRDVDGEDDADNARRELIEEVGLDAATIEPLGISYQSPGMTDSSVALFLATDCRAVERTPHGPEEEHADVFTIPLAEAVDWVLDGRIRNSSTVIGLLLAERALRGR